MLSSDLVIMDVRGKKQLVHGSNVEHYIMESSSHRGNKMMTGGGTYMRRATDMFISLGSHSCHHTT